MSPLQPGRDTRFSVLNLMASAYFLSGCGVSGAFSGAFS
jgi:hypothetical protein